MDINIEDSVITIKRHSQDSSVYILMNFGHQPVTIKCDFEMGDKVIDSCDVQWNGAGSLLAQRVILDEILTINPSSIALYQGI